jgi:hypothetical protein
MGEAMTEKIQFPLVASRIVAMEALRNQLKNLEDTIGSLHQLTLTKPRNAEWLIVVWFFLVGAESHRLRLKSPGIIPHGL